MKELFLDQDRDPTATGVQVGNLVVLPRVSGIDPRTGEPGLGVRGQLELALANVSALLESVGGSLDNLGRVTVFMDDLSDREALEAPWVAPFPRYEDRPARKVMRTKLPQDRQLQLEAIAVLDASRQLITIPGHTGRDPSVRIGPYVFSSRIPGSDPETGKTGDGAEQQTRFAFQNVRNLVEGAGGRVDDITQLTLFTRGPQSHRLADEPWQAMFPDPGRRPALHVVTTDLPPNLEVMLEAIAGPPLTEIFSEADFDPIPCGVRVGDLLFFPRITGFDPTTGAFPDGLGAQLDLIFRNMRQSLERAGASPENVAHVTFFMPDLAERKAFNVPWVEMFPDPDDRPPYKYMPAPVADGCLIQMEMYAVPGGRRKVIEVPGVAHQDPIPMGVTIGRYFFSSRIVGTDPDTGRGGQGLAEQMRLCARNMDTLLRRAGATTANLTQVLAFVKAAEDRQAVAGMWERQFADAASRPPLRVVVTDLPGLVVRLEMMGLL